MLPVDAANSIAGPPLLSLPCDKLLYRRAEVRCGRVSAPCRAGLLTRVCGFPQERGKKDVLEVVMLRRPGRRQMKQVAAVFEQSGNEDVLELQMANAAEARAWIEARRGHLRPYVQTLCVGSVYESGRRYRIIFSSWSRRPELQR